VRHGVAAEVCGVCDWQHINTFQAALAKVAVEARSCHITIMAKQQDHQQEIEKL
jgi:hypothetical protein